MENFTKRCGCSADVPWKKIQTCHSLALNLMQNLRLVYVNKEPNRYD